MIIYYDSKTGTVQRFVDKVKKKRPEWIFIKIEPSMKIDREGHFLTFTTKIGHIPETTAGFLENENNKRYIKSVSSSGNMNWGEYFAVAADKISEQYNIPILMKFELSGTNTEVEYFINYVEENLNG